MNKRQFLAWSAAGGALAALASFGVLYPSLQSAMARLIRHELDYLALDDKGLAQFVEDYARSAARTERLVIKGYAFAGLDASQSGRIHDLVSRYLLSTDFFINRMDEGRTVHYLGLHNPHASPCANPFSQTYYPPGLA